MIPAELAALIGLGFVSGLLFSLLTMLLWMAVAGPFQEWICELTLDRWHRRAHPPYSTPSSSDGPFSIVVSDIHVDTWTGPEDSKYSAFLQFLDWVKNEPRLKDFYINGDIMDFPPHPLNQPPTPILRVDHGPINSYPDQIDFPSLGSLNPMFDPILEGLGTLNKRPREMSEMTVTYLTGNHDIGLYGLRYIRPTLAWSAFHVAWNPGVLLRMEEGRHIYMEHGHLHDPFMWLYLRYAVLEILQGAAPSSHRLTTIGKTRHKHIRSRPVELPIEELYFEGKGDVIPPKGEGFSWLARMRFRQAARRLFRNVETDEREKVKVITMGHTHLPDRYEFPGGRLYINSGDWAGNDSNQCFLLIRANGVVSGPHQWRAGLTLDEVIAATN
jgi:UDP-2,3-diacylglucosamine pyrophosphatase LpxH